MSSRGTAHPVLHFAQHDDTSGLLPALAQFHDTERYPMYFATLNPITTRLRAVMIENEGE